TLTGTNFTGATSVLFNGASASFTNALTNNLDLRITAVVPPDAISGPITIVTPHGNVTSTTSFQVPSPALSLTFNPANELQVRWPGTSSAWVPFASTQVCWSGLKGLTAVIFWGRTVPLPSQKQP
ncbi:MAG: hypothetical protein ACRD2Y_07105, partial [Terriglobales bacterium]